MNFFTAVCHPVTSARLRLPSTAKFVSTLAWTTSAIIMLPVLLYANTINYSSLYDHDDDNAKTSCIIMWPQEIGVRSPTTFTLYSLCLGFAIPLTLILLFYYLVIKRLRSLGPKRSSKERRRPHRKVTRLVLTVITVYILCWLPYWVSQLALINSPPDTCKTKLEITIFVLAGCLGYSNSAINPILYAFLSDNFKKSFLNTCFCSSRTDLNAQLRAENTFLNRFGRQLGYHSSEKTTKNLNQLGLKTTRFTTSAVESVITTPVAANAILNDAVLPLDATKLLQPYSTTASTSDSVPGTLFTTLNENLPQQPTALLQTDF